MCLCEKHAKSNGDGIFSNFQIVVNFDIYVYYPYFEEIVMKKWSKYIFLS